MKRLSLTLAASLTCAMNPPVAADEIDFAFSPGIQSVVVDEIVEVQIIIASDGFDPQPFDALDAIFLWDPEVLEFIEADQSDAEAVFFLSGFLSDPDGINDDVTDGDALFTALVPPGETVDAPPAPDDLIVTTLRFQALQETDSTVISYAAQTGDFGHTRALLAGFDKTGDVSAITKIVVLPVDTCPWDLSDDGSVGFVDLLILLEAWGPNPGHPADFDGSGIVGFADLLKLLSAWGPCPAP